MSIDFADLIERSSLSLCRSISRSLISVWLLIRSVSTTRSLLMRIRSASCSARILAVLMLIAELDRSSSIAANCAARRASISRDWSIRAYSRSRSISIARCSVS